MKKLRKKVQTAVAVATISTAAVLSIPHFAQPAYASSSKNVPTRHFARSFAIKNSMTNNHRASKMGNLKHTLRKIK